MDIELYNQDGFGQDGDSQTRKLSELIDEVQKDIKLALIEGFGGLVYQNWYRAGGYDDSPVFRHNDEIYSWDNNLHSKRIDIEMSS